MKIPYPSLTKDFSKILFDAISDHAMRVLIHRYEGMDRERFMELLLFGLVHRVGLEIASHSKKFDVDRAEITESVISFLKTISNEAALKMKEGG